MLLLARLLSYVFHPLFAALISIFLLFQLPVYLNYKFSPVYHYYVYAALFLNLVVAPLLISLYFKRKKLIDSLEMKSIRERRLPYLISALFYLFTYFLLQKINFPELYLAIFKAATLVVCLLLAFAQFDWKVSAHLSGLGGICGMLIVAAIELRVDTTPLLIAFVLISGLVAGSRLFLKAHSPLEVISGFLLGLGMQLSILL